MPLVFFKKCIFLLLFLSFINCTSHQNSNSDRQTYTLSTTVLKKEYSYVKDTSVIERIFIDKKLVNIKSLDSNIRVVLHYSTSHNFLNRPLYLGLTECYLPCDVAIKLCNAEYFLRTQFPNYHLI